MPTPFVAVPNIRDDLIARSHSGRAQAHFAVGNCQGSFSTYVWKGQANDGLRNLSRRHCGNGLGIIQSYQALLLGLKSQTRMHRCMFILLRRLHD